MIIMDKILDLEEELIDLFNKQDFTCKLRDLRKIIKENNLTDTNNDIVRYYIRCANELDLYIYYFNKKINKLIDNRECGL